MTLVLGLLLLGLLVLGLLALELLVIVSSPPPQLRDISVSTVSILFIKGTRIRTDARRC